MPERGDGGGGAWNDKRTYQRIRAGGDAQMWAILVNICGTIKIQRRAGV